MRGRGTMFLRRCWKHLTVREVNAKDGMATDVYWHFIGSKGRVRRRGREVK